MSANIFNVAACLICLVLLLVPADGRGFLIGRHPEGLASRDRNAFDRNIQTAVGEALGCGGQLDEGHHATIEATLKPIWRTLPKISTGSGGNARIERRFLRYLVHRYFSGTASLLIRGFKPSRPTNASAWGGEDILSQRVPAYVESVLESQHVQVNGFDFVDAVLMVATVEQLIFDSESVILEQVYQHQRKPMVLSMSEVGLGQVLVEFMVRWLLGEDDEGIRILLGNQSMIPELIPHWDQIVGFLHGEVKALDYQRRQRARSLTRPGHNALAQRFSFEDAHQAVGNIRSSFASFWESECITMKASLIEMDPLNTGRVPLSKFHGTGLNAEWRFGESEAYLRDLGALDETSTWRGKQVIIANYIQGASNCIVGAEHYLVCCASECESVLAEIETTIGAPLAPVSELLPVVGNMTSQTTLDHDDPPKLAGALTDQLEQIAATHGGKVPLHGRLFTQSLHYAFPHERAFPQKAGSNVISTPGQYGDNSIATPSEMAGNAAQSSLDAFNATMNKQELEWMSQWSPEEELIADYSELETPWLTGRMVALGGMVSFLVLGGGVLRIAKVTRGSMALDSDMYTDCKTHFV